MEADFGFGTLGPGHLWDSYEIGLALVSISYASGGKYLPASYPSGPRILTTVERVAFAARGLRALGRRDKDRRMLDAILLALGLGFFALSVAYVLGCERL